MNSYENLGILIADKEGAVRQQIVSHLSEKCWVWTFDRGKEALEKLKKSQIDILISGLKLKDMTGLEFLNQAKRIYPQTYVVITASASVLSKKMESLKEIASDFISKPVKEKQLTLVIKRAVDYQQLFKKKEFYQELSILDSLTNVYNRRYLDLELSREIERSKRFSHFFSLLLVDIDNFKAYNDAYGHQAGDSFLRKFAALLMTSSRIMDSVFRYGGDEFIVIFPETSKEDAANLARRIEASIRKGKFEGLEVFSGGRLSCSMGIASYPEDGLSAEALLSVADRMMYKAKKQKKD